MKRLLNGPARRAAVISLLLVSTEVAAQQRPVVRPIPRGTSTIRGQVLDSITKSPVPGCSMRIGASGSFATLISDSDGAYQLEDVAAARYHFFLQCPAHLALCSAPGPDAPNCREVEVLRDEVREHVNFLVVPGAIARGQVMTSDGHPVPRANVGLGRGMRGEPTMSSTSATTDLDGNFELTNLPPGEWRLEVEIPPVPGGLRPPVVYYPGGLSWEEAGGVALEAGKVIDGLTITVPRINENVLTIVVPPADATISGIAVSVLRKSPLAVNQINLNIEGIGMLKGIMPGRHFVTARAQSRDKQWVGFEVVDFIEDSYEARLQLQPTGAIAGRITTDKGDLPPLDGVIAGASWIYDGEEVNPLAADEAQVAADGSFRIDQLFGTRRLMLRALGLEWEVAAIRQGRTDVTTSGIAVVPDSTIEATIVLRRR